MKEIGLHVLYTPPIVKHDHSAHDYISNFTVEKDLYQKTTKLLEFPNSWSSHAKTLLGMIFDLWVWLYEYDYIELYDVKAAKE